MKSETVILSGVYNAPSQKDKKAIISKVLGLWFGRKWYGGVVRA